MTGWSGFSEARISRGIKRLRNVIELGRQFTSVFCKNPNGTVERNLGLAEITVGGREGDANVVVLGNCCQNRSAGINETAWIEIRAGCKAASRREHLGPVQADGGILFISRSLFELKFLLVSRADGVVIVLAARGARFVERGRALQLAFRLCKLVGILKPRRTGGIQAGLEGGVFNLKKHVAGFDKIAFLIVKALQDAAHLCADFNFTAAFGLTEHFNPAGFVCRVNRNCGYGQRLCLRKGDFRWLAAEQGKNDQAAEGRSSAQIHDAQSRRRTKGLIVKNITH